MRLERIDCIRLDLLEGPEPDACTRGPTPEVGLTWRSAHPDVASVVLGAGGVAVLDCDLGEALRDEPKRTVAVRCRQRSRLDEIARHHGHRPVTLTTIYGRR
jgi:hypothetical protein